MLACSPSTRLIMENQTDSQYVKARPTSIYQRFCNALFSTGSDPALQSPSEPVRPTPSHPARNSPPKPQPQPKSRAPKPRPVLPRKLIIGKSNLSKYLKEPLASRIPYFEVLEIVWQAGELNADILKQFPNVTEFDCHGQQLDDIEAIGCLKKLKYLDCSQNHIVALGELEGCSELEKIKCNRNQLVTLVGLGSRLKTIKCNRNNLTSLEGLENCKQLNKIKCSHNKISTLGALQGCTLLSELACDHNQLYDLNGLEDCSSLKCIMCNNNSLTSIEALQLCISLELVDCRNNKLSSLTGLENKVNLIKLWVGRNRLTSLQGLAGCTALSELRAPNNKIRSTKGIDSCVALTELHMENNNLSKLVLGCMPKLKIVDCDKNALVSLEGLTNCPALEILHCISNCISRLPDFSTCPLLRVFICKDNVLTSLKGLEGLLNLKKLNCEHNCLVNLKGLEGCRSLHSLDCDHNRITTIEHIIRLRNLRNFAYRRNPLGYPSVQVEHFLHMIGGRNGESSTIYNNVENVSDSAVKESVFVSIQNLLKDPTPSFSINDLKGSGLSDKAIKWLTIACDDNNRNSNYLITYRQLLSYVWQRVCTSEHKEELIRVLEQQVTESKGRCQIGRLTRLLSVLVGFYDDINIAISGGAQICAAIKVAKKSVRPYDALTHRTLVATHLADLGYTDEETQPWLDAIYDPEEASS